MFAMTKPFKLLTFRCKAVNVLMLRRFLIFDLVFTSIANFILTAVCVYAPNMMVLCIKNVQKKRYPPYWVSQKKSKFG